MHSKRAGIIGILVSTLSVMILCMGLTPTKAETIAGAPGSSPQWGSGWIKFAPPIDFAKGDRLRLLVGGSANKILVRLLPEGQSPDTTAGLLGGPIDVPQTRIVEVTLPEDRKQVSQISVHGGPNPWDKFPLGGGNGPATVESIERLRP